MTSTDVTTATPRAIRERASLSIRARLAIWYTAAFAVLLGIVLAVGYVVLTRALLDDIDEFVMETAGAVGSTLRETLPAAGSESSAAEETAAVRRVLADYEFSEMGLAVFADAPTSGAPGTMLRLSAVSRSGASRSMPVGTLTGEAEWRAASDVARRARRSMQAQAATVHGIERVAAVPVVAGGHVFVVAVSQSLERQQQMVAHVREAILLGLPLALLLAAAGGYALARASLQPVDAMRERAASIGEGSLHARLPVANVSDELGRLSQTFNDLLDRIERAFEHRRRFMADASHELRTPIAILSGETELALAQPWRTSAEYRAALEVIDGEARRLARVVDDLFLLARGDASAQPLLLTELYLEELVGDCVDSFGVMARRKGITLHFTPALELRYSADEKLLRRLVINLLDNAIKYTTPGGRVTARLDVSATGAIVIAVEDTGAGMAPEHHARIFERFYRVPSSFAGGPGDSSGAGLGLPIAAWVAQMHGGTLRLAWSSPHGTRFEAELPPGPAIQPTGVDSTLLRHYG
jgi:heavy metal sensor kinase